MYTKAFIYPVIDQCGESQSALAQGSFELPTFRSTVEHTKHQTTRGGVFFLFGGGVDLAKTAPPCVGHS